MKKTIRQTLITFVISVLLATILMMTLSILTDGMYLIGIPNFDKVEKVTISDPSLSDEVKEITDAENIELAVKLSGFLRYAPFAKVEETAEPIITVTFFTADGKEVSVSANHDTVWWKDKPHVLKSPNDFVKFTEILFFQSDLQD